jgi:hypothetical protein
MIGLTTRNWTGGSRSWRVHVRLSMLLVAALAVTWGASIAAPRVSASPSDNSVLILDTSVAGGSSSTEATYAASLGFDVDVVDAVTWAGLSAADFGAYRAIILGDPQCGYGETAPYIGAAEANASTWGAAVDGNVIIVGSDPELSRATTPARSPERLSRC